MIKVLIVDDEKLVRKGFISIMPWEQFGMTVAGEAANGERALEFMRSNPVDLLVVDITMPVLSGLELMKIVSSEFPHVKMVVLTCHQDFSYIQEAMRLGAIDYIVKTQLEMETAEEILKRIAGRIGANKLSKPSGKEYDQPAANPKYSEQINECIMKAIEYVRLNICSEFTQDAVAREVNMSRGYFSQSFKEIVGVSFGEFVKAQKLHKARELLETTTRPVYWIAQQLGFSDEKYFSRVFKEATGYLPTEYRNQTR